MYFQPKTEQEIADGKLLKKGVYDFEIEAASEEVSKVGHSMIKVRLRVSNGNGAARVLTDYLLPEMPEKFRHAAVATGLLHRYDAGSLSDSDLKGKRGRLKLGIEKGKPGFPPRNVVADYLVTTLPERDGRD